MPYESKPTYRYTNLGGINTKVSPYLNNEMEFLRLENMDFQQPGSLTKRWGSTQYFGQSLTAKVQGLYEYNRVSGASYIFAAAGGTLGVCTANGFSTVFSGSTAGTSYFITFGASNVDGFSLGSFNMDFDTLQDNAFIANGRSFVKATTGHSITFFGLPRFVPMTMVQIAGATFNAGSSGVAGGLTGMFFYKMSWVNSYGMAGAASQATGQPSNIMLSNLQGATANVIGVAGVTTGYGLVPPNFDIRAVALWRSDSQPIAPGGHVAAFLNEADVVGDSYGASYYLFNKIEDLQYSLIQVLGVSAGSLGVTFVDTNTKGGFTFLNTSVVPWNWYPFSITSRGLSGPVGLGVTYIPRFLETHDNFLFAAGFSTTPSLLQFSDVNEPENFQPDFNIEVRTNDGEGLSGLKSYNGNLVVFKPSSFHGLNTAAENPLDWNLAQISSEYGCLSNRAVTEYGDLLLFLDRKGIVRFNGANIEILSTKVDPIFQRMNVRSAMSEACLTYDKQRNEILCDIPVDGATMNNMTVVWDIVGNCWSTYSGYRPAVTTIATGALQQETVFYGGYSGLVSYFGASFTSDNGVGFTCVAKSGFTYDMGRAVEKLYRRVYTDSVPQGDSSWLGVNVYQDYGASIVFGATIPQTPFQTKIEMGVPARAISVEYVMGSTFALTLHGFTIEYRFLRDI